MTMETTMKSCSFETTDLDGFTDLFAELVNRVPGCRCTVESGGGDNWVLVTQFYQDDAAWDRMWVALKADPRFCAYEQAYVENWSLERRRGLRQLH